MNNVRVFLFSGPNDARHPASLLPRPNHRAAPIPTSASRVGPKVGPVRHRESQRVFPQHEKHPLWQTAIPTERNWVLVAPLLERFKSKWSHIPKCYRTLDQILLLLYTPRMKDISPHRHTLPSYKIAYYLLLHLQTNMIKRTIDIYGYEEYTRLLIIPNSIVFCIIFRSYLGICI